MKKIPKIIFHTVLLMIGIISVCLMGILAFPFMHEALQSVFAPLIAGSHSIFGYYLFSVKWSFAALSVTYGALISVFFLTSMGVVWLVDFALAR